MPDAVTSAFGTRQYAEHLTQGDRQDEHTGRAGRVQQQANASAHDSWGLRWSEGARP